ncbi:MAG: DUF2948 family protein [Pseudomonadota bacterium]
MGQTLAAEDAEDLEVLSARLQDGITTVGEMKYLPRSRRFAAMFSRFMWEEVDQKDGRKQSAGRYRRVRAGLTFNSVLSVQARNIDPRSKDAFLSLLAIDFRAGGAEGTEEIRLVFAGDAMMRLQVECIDGHLRDIGPPWRTQHLPHHDDADEEPKAHGSTA